MDKHLFLFGSGPPFTPAMAKRFTEVSPDGPISILFIEREGMDWKDYMPVFTQALMDAGADEFKYLPLFSTSSAEICKSVERSAGIVIGGGDTNLYADYIVDTRIAWAIRNCYEKSVPVAGFSAGALISSNPCIISPNDNPDGKLQHRPGLGLISDVILSVHFSQWKDGSHLKEAVRYFPSRINLGIDERTGVYFRNNEYVDAEGDGVYTIINNNLNRIY
ncbi:Type 1 glutamine amidotransferase-like domain-containing protein [Virgibacillus siamensis]|uniref:Type 1 glutamine amidotransferase-like domain-containing protein n=1 Tax=Virgibacillus siamensis TaxID=480071 RepID=UPI0009875ADC|nr:Type 1 glutamine amidotransferase-like domain-containing protein [Virgibacillus siamensis]